MCVIVELYNCVYTSSSVHMQSTESYYIVLYYADSTVVKYMPSHFAIDTIKMLAFCKFVIEV